MLDDRTFKLEDSPLPGQGKEDAYRPHPEMQMMQDSVQFTNDQVLKANISPTVNIGKIMADQAAGMLMQDVESFSQGMMQIATAAISRVTAEIIATDGAKGETAMTQITQALGELPTFISDMAGAAQTMESSFTETGGQNDIKTSKSTERNGKDKGTSFFFRGGSRS